MTFSKRKLGIGIGAGIALVIAILWLASGIPGCSDSIVTATLKSILTEHAPEHPKFAWMNALLKMPDDDVAAEPFNIVLRNQREDRRSDLKRYCTADLTMAVNDTWVNRRMVQLDKQAPDDPRKIALGIIAIARGIGQASGGDSIATRLNYSVQWTDANDVYVSIE